MDFINTNIGNTGNTMLNFANSLSSIGTMNPYLSDVGAGLVFGLGYYVINYQFGDNQDNSNFKDKKAPILLEHAKTIEEFNSLVRQTDLNTKVNPFQILDKINTSSLTPDITIYNNLINACLVRGQNEEAEKLTDELFDFASPVQPDLSSFNILLKGISIKIDKLEYSQNNQNVIGTTSYINNSDTNVKEQKTALVATADKILLNLQETYNFKPDDVTLNTLMDILIKGGDVARAWVLFDQMKTKYRVEPDRYSYTTIIKAFRYDPDANKLDKIFGILDLFKNSAKACKATDEIIFNCMIDVCLKLGAIDKAEKVLRSMKEYSISPSKITYAIMITGYGQVYQLDAALKIFDEMRKDGIEPNEVVYGCLLNTCVRCSNFSKVIELYEEMDNNSIKMNIILYTTLIKAFSKNKDLESALKVYEKMHNDKSVKPNIIVYNAMLDCCVENNSITKMNEIYESLKSNFLESDYDSNVPSPDLSTYSTVIKGYAKAKDMDKVFDIYSFLTKSKEFVLDEIIYNTVLDACAKTGNFEKAMEICESMRLQNVRKSNVTYSILIKLYSINKEDTKALQLLEEMKSLSIKPGVIVYTCLIQTCLKSNRYSMAIDLFEELKSSGLKLDHVLYNTIVNGSIFHGKLENACKYVLESFEKNVRMADDMYNSVNF